MTHYDINEDHALIPSSNAILGSVSVTAYDNYSYSICIQQIIEHIAEY